ncbi:alpha/beta hydrolase [Lactobacillus sp. ESL0684]|uniref:alpha/beta hydrolase n=1 Tax=Lactobacillus sp. ESL0684 TaxID=2983213 RepID=UPI0023F9DB6B|nr:alpha/beta hydrolase [Lactobacillus sp. ESL0684]WEV44313.1 alpha/beta hydrolase [Lactobacillus sp. ESL0684]
MKIKKINLVKDNPEVTLTTYLLADSPEMLAGKARPAIIICPGGGYFNCSDREAEPVAMYFASQGYHAFVLRYSTYQTGELTMPDLSKPLPVKEASLYPRQIRELGLAMLLIKQNASDWHVDPDQVGVCGFSAGGNVAALYATCYNEAVLTDYFQVAAQQLRPAFAITGYALTDYHLLDRDLAKQTSDMGAAFMRASNVAYLGKEIPDYELEAAVSPVDHVDSQTPPFFIWTTATDQLVSAVHSLNLASALAEANIPYEIHVFGEGEHGLSLASQATSQVKSQIKPAVSEWTHLCAKWLTKRFPLNLAEK